MIRLVLSAALAGTLAGCGLIDPDIADFDLSLPTKEFVVDTAQWEMNIKGESFPAIDCSSMAAICTASGMEPCTGANCFPRCGDDGNCEVLVQVQLWSTVNLAVEKPELSEIEGQPILDVTIKKVWFDVVENTLTVDTPEMTVLVAPANVMSSGSPQALEVGTIPVVAAGDLVEEGQLQLLPDGEKNLKAFMKDYETPFNIILGSTVLVKAGDPVPMGLVRAEVNVAATAGL